MTESEQVCLIDDDEAVRDSVGLLLENHEFEVSSFGSAEEFLSSIEDGLRPACVVSDVKMPGLSGIDLQRLLAEQQARVPLILITGHGDIAMAVAAVKAGAHDFLEKPFDDKTLLESINSALDEARRKKAHEDTLQEFAARVGELSARQRQVMDLAVKGYSNKEIAQELGISPRTVETYRAWVMEKTGARNLADLVRLAMRLEDMTNG
jgi:two-component system, LuxR family, response regulator FixJ